METEPPTPDFKSFLVESILAGIALMLLFLMLYLKGGLSPVAFLGVESILIIVLIVIFVLRRRA